MDKPIKAIFYRDWDNAHIPEILEEIYLRKIYEPFLIGKRDLIIADIGSNILITGQYFSKYAKQVYCVEPALEHQEIIKKIIEFNKLTNITLCPYAISNKNGTTKFYHNENTTAHSLNLVADPKDFEEVETIDFEEFVVRNKLEYIDLLKLDCEGVECEIIASDAFKKYVPKIKVIVFEYHAWAQCGQAQFGNMLRDLGFQVNWIQGIKAAVGTAVRI